MPIIKPIEICIPKMSSNISRKQIFDTFVKLNIGYIDTAMLLIDYNICKGINWINNRYDADGIYIKECYTKNKDNHIYVDNDLCYYNKLLPTKKDK